MCTLAPHSWLWLPSSGNATVYTKIAELCQGGSLYKTLVCGATCCMSEMKVDPTRFEFDWLQLAGHPTHDDILPVARYHQSSARCSRLLSVLRLSHPVQVRHLHPCA